MGEDQVHFYVLFLVYIFKKQVFVFLKEEITGSFGVVEVVKNLCDLHKFWWMVAGSLVHVDFI